MLTFYGWTVTIEKDKVIVRKEGKGHIIQLPGEYDDYRVKSGKAKVRFRDFDSIFGGRECEKRIDASVMTIRFKIGKLEYIVLLARHDEHTTIIHGYSHWDGDVYGYIVEGVE